VGVQSQRVPWVSYDAADTQATHNPPKLNREMGDFLVAASLGSMLIPADAENIFGLLLRTTFTVILK